MNRPDLERGASAMAYRPDIDGLRAIAVLLVISYHAFPTIVRGGFVGVDVFFVISGYLITGILLKDLDARTFSYAAFASRRVRRLFPALLAVLFACLTAGAVLMLEDEYRALGRHVAAGGGFASNFVLWGESGYFEDAAEAKPLLHLWSLAVEEQFYLVWPLFVAFSVRRRWNLPVALVIVSLSSLLLGIAAAHCNPVAGFFSPLARVWELSLGGLLASMERRRDFRSPIPATVSGTVGGALILVSAALLDKDSRFPGALALLPTVGAGLVLAGKGGSPNRGVLSRPWLVGIGLISYPLYLWHWPLLSFVRIWEFHGVELKRALKAASVLISFVLAYSTWRWVELPVRRSPRHLGILACLLGLMALSVGLGYGISRRERPSDPWERELMAASKDRAPFQSSFGEGRVSPFSLRGSSAETALFIGDSHANQLLPAIASLYERGRPRMTAEFAAFGRCAPSPRTRLATSTPSQPHLRCDDVFGAAMSLAARPNVGLVVFAGNWDIRPRGAYDVESMTALGGAIRRLTDQGKAVVVVLANPQGREFDPKAMLRSRHAARLLGRGVPTPPEQASMDAVSLRNRASLRMPGLKQAAEANGGRTLDPFDVLCPEDRCPLVLNGRPVYSDSNHLRPFFAAMHADRLAAALGFH